MARRTAAPWKRGDRVIIYIRVSDVGDREDTLISPDVQRRQCERWARDNGISVVDIVEDVDKSGRDIMKRQLNATIKRVGEGVAEGIVVWKISRWGRNVMDSLNAVAALHAVNGWIGSTSENLDEIDTPQGKFNLHIALAMAQLQSDQIGEVWQDIQDRRRELGLPPDGRPRFGYVRTPMGRVNTREEAAREYTVDPVAGPWLKRVYQDYVAGATISSLVRLLNANNIKTTGGSRWRYRSLIRNLDSGFGAGLIVDRRSCDDGAPPEDSTYTDAAHEAVIDADTWAGYCRRRAGIERRPPREVASPYRLAGLVMCAGCGRKMFTRKKSYMRRDGLVEYREYFCNQTNTNTNIGADVRCTERPHIKAEALDELVHGWLLATAEGDGAFAAHQAKIAESARAQADLTKLDAEIEKLKRRVTKATAAMLDTEDEDDKEALQITKSAAMDELKTLRRTRQDLEITAADDAAPVEAFGGLAALWDRAEPSVINQGLRKLIAQVQVVKQEGGDGPRLWIIPAYDGEPSEVAA